MAKRFFYVLLINVVVGLTCVNAQEARTEQSPEKTKTTKFEQYLSRTDALILSKKSLIGKLEETSTDVSVSVAWELGKTEKVYAATIGEQTVDFEQLQKMLEDMDKMIQAIGSEFNKVETTSMRLSSESGLSMGYYAYTEGSGTPKKNLYLKIKETFITQGPSTEPLVKLRELVAQARQKLISMGAK
jgi:hypothetical protein